MKTVTLNLIVTCMILMAVVFASCRTASQQPKEETTKPTITQPTSKVEIPEPKKEEVIATQKEEPQYGGILTFVASTTENFDPYRFGGLAPSLTSFVFEKLVVGNWATDRELFDWPSYKGDTPSEFLTGQLAEKWDIPDPQTLIIHLRKGVNFHNKPPLNGREFVADDVVWNLKRMQTSPFLVQQWFSSMSTIKAIDKYTVEIKFGSAIVGLPYEILDERSAQFIGKESVSAGENEIKNWQFMIGTGPFMIEDRVPESSITFKKNPLYWGYDELHAQNKLPYVDGVRVLVMTDKSTVQSALRTGKIDRLSEVAWKDAVNLKETNPNLKFRSYFTAIPRAIRPRNDTAPFNDIRVRQALCMAIDYKGLAKTFFGDTPYLINGFLFPVHVGLYTPYEKYPKEIQDIYTYNTQKAKELLAQAGFPNGFKTTLNANPTTEPGLPEIIQSYLKQIGVETEIKYYETGAFNALRFSKNYDGLIQHWQAFYVNPLSLFGWYAEPTHTFNVGVVNDKELTRMYNEANSTFDDAKRKELIKQMDLYGMKQAYFIPVPIPLEYTIWQSWIKAYSGEGVIGLWQIGALSARIWVDQNLKSKLGK